MFRIERTALYVARKSYLPMLQMHWENELNKIGFILQKADSADRGSCDDATVRMGDGAPQVPPKHT